MKKLKIHKFKTTQLNSDFNSISEIEIEETPFARGGFGEVYLCKVIDNRTISQIQVIKILLDDGTGSSVRGINTISKLQDKIIEHNGNLKQNNQPLIESISSLQALPQFSFEGILDGKPVLGYSANYLSNSKWFEFGDIFNHDDLDKRTALRNGFYNLPHDFRLKFAHDLAEGFLHLQKMNFIYADLNPKNFFVNQTEGKLCLIDFEGGAVNENPETYGKPGQWLAPEIQKQLINGPSLIKVDLNTDTWAVAIGIHFILFPFHPLFFLKRLDVNVMTDYFKSFQWPNIDKNSPLFNPSTSGAYDWFLEKINTELSTPLLNTFKETINHGYFNSGRRLSYKQWLNAIDGLMVPPKIKSFTIEPDTVTQGSPITLKWEVDLKTNLLSINNSIGDVTGKNEITIVADESTVYTLTATGHFGKDESSAHIRIFPTPFIKSLQIPSPILNTKTDIQLSIPAFNYQTNNSSNINIPKFHNYSIELNTSKQKMDVTPVKAMIEIEKISLLKRVKILLKTIKKEYKNEINRKYASK